MTFYPLAHVWSTYETEWDHSIGNHHIRDSLRDQIIALHRITMWSEYVAVHLIGYGRHGGRMLRHGGISLYTVDL